MCVSEYGSWTCASCSKVPANNSEAGASTAKLLTKDEARSAFGWHGFAAACDNWLIAPGYERGAAFADGRKPLNSLGSGAAGEVIPSALLGAFPLKGRKRADGDLNVLYAASIAGNV